VFKDSKDFIVRFKCHIKNGTFSSVTHLNASNKIGYPHTD